MACCNPHSVLTDPCFSLQVRRPTKKSKGNKTQETVFLSYDQVLQPTYVVLLYFHFPPNHKSILSGYGWKGEPKSNTGTSNPLYFFAETILHTLCYINDKMHLNYRVNYTILLKKKLHSVHSWLQRDNSVQLVIWFNSLQLTAQVIPLLATYDILSCNLISCKYVAVSCN